MDVEIERHARILALAADALRQSFPMDEEIQDRLSVIANRLEGLAELIRDKF